LIDSFKSKSFAIAGYFKLKIYIVSLNSPAMNEENLGTLFSELPKQCIVLLEDIDTAGLTHP
jgi:mitochondrial chaperone BCS1